MHKGIGGDRTNRLASKGREHIVKWCFVPNVQFPDVKEVFNEEHYLEDDYLYT